MTTSKPQKSCANCGRKQKRPDVCGYGVCFDWQPKEPKSDSKGAKDSLTIPPKSADKRASASTLNSTQKRVSSGRSADLPQAKLETFEEDVACIRACLERLLMVLDSGAYKDYQLEKWGRIVRGKKHD